MVYSNNNSSIRGEYGTSAAPPRMRVDPSEYARQKQLKAARAKTLRENIRNGTTEIMADEQQQQNNCTFKPNLPSKKTYRGNPHKKQVDTTLSFQENNIDSLDDQVSRTVITSARGRPGGHLTARESYYEEEDQDSILPPTSDVLDNEMFKQKTKTNAWAGGPCKRNSTCNCPQCDMTAQGLSSNFMPQKPQHAPPVMQQQQQKLVPTPPPQQQTYNPKTSPQKLSLLKAKLKSRRKMKSAPGSSSTASLLEDETGAVAHSPRPSQQRQQQRPTEYSNAPSSYNTTTTFPGVQVDMEYVADAEATFLKCNGCGRSFNEKAFEKHGRVCKKVFQQKRKVFKTSLVDAEAEKLAKEAKAKNKVARPGRRSKSTPIEEAPIKTKANSAPGWKKKSSAFRQAMKQSQLVAQAEKNGTALPPPVASEPDPDYIQCPTCSRRFNAKAGERHMPHCAESAKRNAARLGNARGSKKQPPPPKGRLGNARGSKKQPPPPKGRPRRPRPVKK